MRNCQFTISGSHDRPDIDSFATTENMFIGLVGGERNRHDSGIERAVKIIGFAIIAINNLITSRDNIILFRIDNGPEDGECHSSSIGVIEGQ